MTKRKIIEGIGLGLLMALFFMVPLAMNLWGQTIQAVVIGLVVSVSLGLLMEYYLSKKNEN